MRMSVDLQNERTLSSRDGTRLADVHHHPELRSGSPEESSGIGQRPSHGEYASLGMRGSPRNHLEKIHLLETRTLRYIVREKPGLFKGRDDFSNLAFRFTE
jgi:hypothetical protein